MYDKAEDKIKTKIVGYTKPTIEGAEDPQDLISYAARVSNPSNQNNFDTADGLLKYCMKHNHWSIFETANVTMEIEAPRDVARQILRHRSFSFQEFSQRYADVEDNMFCIRELRLQDHKNRQNSIEVKSENGFSEWINEWEKDQEEIINLVREKQEKWRGRDAAKEVVRVLMPEGLTMSRMYMNGTVRSWLHYCDLRGGNGTQLEHIWVAKACRKELATILPTLFKSDD